MNYKRLALLVGLIAVAASLFFFSSWTNAMVVSGGEISSGFNVLSKMSPLLAGFLAVVAVGVLVVIVFD